MFDEGQQLELAVRVLDAATRAAAQAQAVPPLPRPASVAVTAFLGAIAYAIAFVLTAGALIPGDTGPKKVEDDEPKPDCKKVKNECIALCSDSSLPTTDFGWTYQKCLRACKEARGC